MASPIDAFVVESASLSQIYRAAAHIYYARWGLCWLVASMFLTPMIVLQAAFYGETGWGLIWISGVFVFFLALLSTFVVHITQLHLFGRPVTLSGTFALPFWLYVRFIGCALVQLGFFGMGIATILWYRVWFDEHRVYPASSPNESQIVEFLFVVLLIIATVIGVRVLVSTLPHTLLSKDKSLVFGIGQAIRFACKHYGSIAILTGNLINVYILVSLLLGFISAMTSIDAWRLFIVAQVPCFLFMPYHTIALSLLYYREQFQE